jgi:hypothetical protein
MSLTKLRNRSSFKQRLADQRPPARESLSLLLAVTLARPMLRGVARLHSSKERTVTIEVKAWLTSMACGKAKELNCGTTPLLARHAREHGPGGGTLPRQPGAGSSWRRLHRRTIRATERCGVHLSYDENLGCQAIATTSPPTCSRAACSRELARDHERPGADASSVRRSFRSDAERVCNLHSLVGR